MKKIIIPNQFPFLLLAFCVAAGSSVAAAIPVSAYAAVRISEIMYDVPGSDTGREWIEIQNTGQSAVDISSWKLFEASTNHSFVVEQGSGSLAPQGVAVIADTPEKFLVDWPNFSGTLINSAFSLQNTGEALVLKDANGVVADEVTFSGATGAAGDGQSLHRSGTSGSVLVAGGATPGSEGSVGGSPSASSTASSLSSDSSDSSVVPDVPDEDIQDEPSVTTTTASASSATPAPPAHSWPVEQQVFPYIKGQKVVTVGADTSFEGIALGILKQPLEKARYIWNFGDGEIREGKQVTHVYRHPGTYIVVLDAAAGDFSSSEHFAVTAVPAYLSISSILSGSQGFVEITNSDTRQLDLSNWRLTADRQTFYLPKHTILAGKNKVRFSTLATNLLVTGTSSVSLLYPNGVAATSAPYILRK